MGLLIPNGEEQPLRVLEFYSGVGGMRYALQLSGLAFTVVEAFDINEVANDVYEHNFGHRPSEGNVSRVKAKQLDAYKADMWLMAPPCQPYTRQGLKKDAKDGRATSFLTMLQRIPDLEHPPTYLLVENVVGFEASVTHGQLIRTLTDAGFAVREFILSPLQFGIPYSRPRYFCLAKRKRLSFLNASLTGSIIRSSAPLLSVNSGLRTQQSNVLRSRQLKDNEPSNEDSPSSKGTSPHVARETVGQGPSEGHHCSTAPSPLRSTQLGSHSKRDIEEAQCEVTPQDIESTLEHTLPVRPVSDFLQEPSAVVLEDFKVPEAIVSRWGDAFDIVTPSSTRCCCFTKSYVKYAKGTGSIIATTPRGMWQDRHVADEKGIVNGGASFDQASGRLVDLAALTLRYFTPREVANLHSFPSKFSFPERVTLKQQYALLGNSLSAEIVASLLVFLVDRRQH